MKAEKRAWEDSGVAGFLHQSGDVMKEAEIDDLSGIPGVKVGGEQALSVSLGDDVVVAAWHHFVN
jgi:hypothetical protein